jgi:TolB protein
MMKKFRFIEAAAILLVWGASMAATNAETGGKMIISREVDATKTIPINLSGFTGEVLSTLKFDLEVVGFSMAGPEQADYLVVGSNASRVEARVSNRFSKAEILAKAYSGASLRVQAHALADDIVEKIRQVPGIARTKIAFKLESGGTSEICIADYDGFNVIKITNDRSLVAAPAWSPGRKKLYYTSYRLGNPDIYAHDLATGERQAIAKYTGLNTSAAVSPDGRRVAMILSKGGSPDIYVSNPDGSGLHQLTSTREDESSPCWSPNGQTLCFASRQTGRASLYTMPAAGGAMKRLRTENVASVTEPDWSPDGKNIAFTTTTGGFHICTVPAQGGVAEVLVPGEYPSWSPNSRTLILSRRNGNRYVLSLLDVPTKKVKDIGQISGNASQPDWAK